MIFTHLYRLFPLSLHKKLTNHSRVTSTLMCFTNCTMKNVLVGLLATEPRAVGEVVSN